MPPLRQNYYETLGVPRTASSGEIRRAYRNLARQCHPDLNPGDKLADQRFRNVEEAYRVLIEPEPRRRYDQTEFKSEPDAPRAVSTGSSNDGAWIDGEAVSDPTLRNFHFSPREDKGAEVFQALLILLFMGSLALLLTGNLVDFYGPPGHISTLNLPSGLGLEGFSGLVPLALLLVLGWSFARRRGSFLVGSLVINTAFWGGLILYCRAAGILQWPDIKRMWPWILPTHLVIVLGARFRRGPMDWTRWAQYGSRS